MWGDTRHKSPGSGVEPPMPTGHYIECARTIELLYKQRPDSPAPSCISQCKLLSGDEAKTCCIVGRNPGALWDSWLTLSANFTSYVTTEHAHKGYRLALALANCNTSRGHCVLGGFKPGAPSWGLALQLTSFGKSNISGFRAGKYKTSCRLQNKSF